MSLYTSSKEKKLWLWAMVVTITIFSTLFFGQPLAHFFSNQNHRAIVFLIVMAFIGIAMLLHSFKTKPSTSELAVTIGVIGVYIMFILRLGMPERSHLMEYSVLAILVHKAFLERSKQINSKLHPALFAFLLCFIIGVLDEILQLFVPYRVFDPIDIIFNGNAIALAIGSHVLIQWTRKRFDKNKF